MPNSTRSWNCIRYRNPWYWRLNADNCNIYQSTSGELSWLLRMHIISDEVDSHSSTDSIKSFKCDFSNSIYVSMKLRWYNRLNKGRAFSPFALWRSVYSDSMQLNCFILIHNFDVDSMSPFFLPLRSAAVFYLSCHWTTLLYTVLLVGKV